MPTLKQLPGLDSLFLYAENSRTPLEVSSLHIYDPSTAPNGIVRFKEILATFDNRLEAGRVRTEHYRWEIPPSLTGQATVMAVLYYTAYPHSFSKRLQLPTAKDNPITNARNMLTVGRDGRILFPLQEGDW